MILVIESSNPDVIHAISELAKKLKVTYRVEPDDSVVSIEERHRRIETLKKFKGGLKKLQTAQMAEALRIVQSGCDMSVFGDGLEYQIEVRQDRVLPFRD